VSGGGWGSGHELSLVRNKDKLCGKNIWKLLLSPSSRARRPSFPGNRGSEWVGGPETTSPYTEGKARVLGDAPGPREDGGSPASSGCQPSPPEGSILPGHPKGIRNIVVFQFPENLEGKGTGAGQLRFSFLSFVFFGAQDLQSRCSTT
jgi:hypothetical protein